MTTPEDGTPHDGTPQDERPGARLADELRLLLDALAQRAEPYLNRLAADESGEHTPATCGWCPLCAALAVARGERPELAVRAAEHAAGLLAVLRSALAEPSSTSSDPSPSPPPEERVQHIPVRRRGTGGC
jgi:hypothetical protein